MELFCHESKLSANPFGPISQEIQCGYLAWLAAIAKNLILSDLGFIIAPDLFPWVCFTPLHKSQNGIAKTQTG